MKRGQASIEFIFLVLIVIVYLTTVVIPLSKEAQDSISDVDSVARANNETQKIANTINDVFLLGEGSKQTLAVFLPEDTIIYCKDKNISFEATLKQLPYPAQCSSGKCVKVFTFSTSTLLTCNTNYLTPGKTILTVEKKAGKIALTKGS